MQKLKSATFCLNAPAGPNTKFIKKKTSEGEKIKLYGLSVSEQYADTWKTEFKYEENPFRRLGVPRRGFRERTVVKGSSEKEKYKQELEQATQTFRANTASTLFAQEHKGYLRQGWSRYPFSLNFTSYDKKSGNLEGIVSFERGFLRPYKVVKRIQGKFSNSKINFTTTGFVSGKEQDNWGLGTEYFIDMNEQFPRQESLVGSWKHPSKINGETNGKVTIRLN